MGVAPGGVEETYVGGLTSPSIRNRRADPRPCGVYATDRRIFLVRASPMVQVLDLAGWVAALALLFTAFVWFILLLTKGPPFGNEFWAYACTWLGYAVLFIWFGSQWYRNSSKVPIGELERRSIWEIERDRVSTVEMRGHDLTFSRIEIHLRSGKARTIFFSERGSYERARALFPSNAS